MPGYPDCRPEFIAAYEKMAQLATKTGVEGEQIQILTPLMYLTKIQIIELGLKLNVEYPCSDESTTLQGFDINKLRRHSLML
jgi:7-cyano-7-deazaguanine synthase in queuosine biosynthesis